MKKFYVFLFTISFSVINLVSFSQISQGGQPLSFQNPQLLSEKIPVEIMPEVDVQRLMAEDSINDIYKDIPWRFGENIPVSFDLNNSGTWDILPKGGRIWRLGIKCPGAFTINLTFDNYRLPPGATLFVYNIDKTQIIGAFTDFNNRKDSAFATTLVMGEEIVIEYFEPPVTAFAGKIHLNQVTHGYRDAFDYVKSFGQSGPCNNNVKCPEAAGWQNQVRSACMLVSGGNGFCSGALVNNTSQDGTPYILTANHCYSNPSTWVFWFNWQSPTCPNPPYSPPYNSISGATLKAKFSASDFCLVQMSSIPPATDSVYYAGWNKKDTAASSGAGIHHPSGDIKKISYSISPYVSSTWSGTPANSHWQVFWSDGVTEPGSSGSPIFDQYHHIVGQLHGGPSACGASQLWDFYGKFSMSWDYGTTPSTRLKDWLDPTNIAGDSLGGFDPNDIPLVQTLNATDISVTSATINATVTPNGWVTNYHFDWGTTPGFGNTTPSMPAGSGFVPVAVNYLLSGLTAGTQYFFRVVGTTISDTLIGDTLNFVTDLPTLLVSPPIQYVGAPSGNTQFLVTSNVSWSVASDSDWCTVTPSGTGNDTIFANFTGNTSITPRIAQITVTGEGLTPQTVTVSQEGVPVILDVTPSNQNVGSTAGNTAFIVTSNTIWTVSANSGWITATPSGTGNDTIHVTYTENIAITERIDTITISAPGFGSIKVTVTQSGAPLILNVNPSNQNVGSTAGNTAFIVTSNTIWAVSANSGWITATPSGTGNDTIQVTYTENIAIIERIDTITISAPGFGSIKVTVTQSGAPLILSVSPSNQNVGSATGNITFTVTSNTDWIVASDASWCMVNIAGSGVGTIVADYTENTAPQVRIANISITVASLPVQTVTVTQAKSTVGIDELKGNDLKIFPNPTKGIFEIVPASKDNILEVQVINMDGTVILKKQYVTEKKYVVDLSSASAGNYQIMIKTNNNLVIRKLVIIK
jgi:Viral BACON domain/Secretion system C-terminal sorting domain/Trypsin-like peptidase domain